MTTDEAQAELMVLRGLADSGNDLALVRERIDRLYWEVCRKHLRHCRCKNVERDALVEIYAKLRFNTKTNITMATAKLVNGVVIRVGGTHYTNANLTDEVARQFLEVFPQRKDWFAVLPSATTAKEVTAEVAEMPSNDEKAEKRPTTSKKRKSPKKGK